MRVISPYIIIILLTLSCKDDVSYIGNPIPKIKFVSISADSLKSFSDSLVIKISYEDGDGDLGDFSADSLSIWVKDSRLIASDRYHLKPLAPTSAGKIFIKGELNIKLQNLFTIGMGMSEQTYFEVKIKDRNQNWSNTVITPTILIMK